uniref:THO complex subunit 2 n=1 Tax=Tanacetum cinerariifolium TaxID=118510 RepID=A0A6L2M2B6_TANCI|nr:THO complex subunit 2 [Tanacetum cinerariifolium]
MGEHSVVSLRLFHERFEEEFLWDSEMIKIKAADLKSKEAASGKGVISQSKIRRKANWQRAASSVLVTIGSHLPDPVHALAGNKEKKAKPEPTFKIFTNLEILTNPARSSRLHFFTQNIHN